MTTRPRQPTFAVETLGCKANQYDTHVLRAGLAAHGLREVPFGPGADAYVVNTCSVTHVAGQKSRKYISTLARENPEAVVVVTGCYADTDPDELVRIAGVDRVFKNADKRFIARFVAEAVARGRDAVRTESEVHESCLEPSLPARVVDFGGQTRPFVKIQDGCDLLCTYCIIPTTRGGLSSRPLDHVVEECRELTEAGHLEVVLTGIHLGGYGHDLGEPDLLSGLLDRLLELPRLERLRLSSIEVQEVRDSLLARAEHPKFCPHFHVPLQSGSDAVLKRMGRRYRREDYVRTMRRIAERVPGVAFNTDVIVGFPGETEADFQATCEVAREVGFSRMHLFPYSDRRGTPSVRLPDKVDPRTKEDRKRRLAAVAAELALAWHSRRVGRSVRVLVEHRRDPATGLLTGYSDDYIKVLFEGPDELRNRLVEVEVVEARPDGALGTLSLPVAG